MKGFEIRRARRERESSYEERTTESKIGRQVIVEKKGEAGGARIKHEQILTTRYSEFGQQEQKNTTETLKKRLLETKKPEQGSYRKN